MKWELEVKESKLNRPWKISGAEITSKKIIYIKLTNGDHIGLGEIGYGSKENLDIDELQRDLENFTYIYKDASVAQFSELARLLDTVDFDCPRIRFAIEAAFLDYLVSATEITPWRIIGTNMIKSVPSVCSLPLFNSVEEGNELLNSSPDSEIYKLKVSKETMAKQIEFINQCDKKLILDGNESWGNDVDDLIFYLQQIEVGKVLFIEEPLAKNSLDQYRRLKDESPIDIFLDETIRDHKHINVFQELCHGIVLKGCKSNSLMRVVMQMSQAKKIGLKTMLGCMVESTIGISTLFAVAYGFDYYDFDGFTKLEEEENPRVFWDKGKVVLANMN